jgi:hypothetical protein
MSISYVSAELRRLVVARSESLCEYCLIAEEDTGFGCEVDHIISEKHGGATHADNLAYSCVCCNQAKGSDVGSIHWATGQFVRFFSPRSDRWGEHFALRGNMLDSRTAIGEATARILGFNRTDRLQERQLLREIGRYPSPAALQRMQG